MSRRSSRPNLSGAAHSASSQKATTSKQVSSRPKTLSSHYQTPTTHQKSSHQKPTTSRPYIAVVSAIEEEEEEEDERKNKDINSVSRDPPPFINTASKTTTPHDTSATSFSATSATPVGSDSLPPSTNTTSTNNAATGVASLSDSFCRRGRMFNANVVIHASGAGGGHPTPTMPTPPLRSYSSPEWTVEYGTRSPEIRNGDIWAIVHRQKQESLERWRRKISGSESVDSDMGSSIGSDAGSVTSSRGKDKSGSYEPHYQAAIASSVFNTLQALKRANMDETAEAMHGCSEETKNNNNNGLNASPNPSPGQHNETGDITPKSNLVVAAVTGQKPPSLSHPSTSTVTSNTLATLTAEQIAQLQASIAYASLVPPSVVVGGGVVGGHNSPAFFSHTPSVSESRNATRPSSNVTSARSTPPPQVHSQQLQHYQQQHHLQPHQQLVAANVFTPVMLSMSRASSRRVSSSSSDDDDDDEYESEVLEESPCRRWQKRKQRVMQNDIPGCDGSYLAMDSEEGFEVVWSELLFSERKKFKDQQEKIANVFDHLIQLDHPNIMKFHNFWMDNENTEQPRVIFIKEYMSSGSLAHFMRKSRMNKKKLQLRSWRRWSSEILSALSYLHDTRSRWYGDNGIIHGNLSCDTVFIQQNGTIKIGSVSLEAINHHVKTCRDQIDHRYFAPEYAAIDSNQRQLTTAVDIYAFGVLALVMASAIQWPTGNGGSGVGGGGNGSGHRSTDEDGGNDNQHSTELNESKLEASLGNDLQAAIERLGGLSVLLSNLKSHIE